MAIILSPMTTAASSWFTRAAFASSITGLCDEPNTSAAAFVSAADRAMRACQEACRELRAMVETINADRAAQ